jgi:hypothetical protein
MPSKRTRTRQLAYELDHQVKWTCEHLKRFSAGLEAMGGTAYEAFTEGGFYDALIERFTRLLVADADGKHAEGFLAAFLHTAPRAEPPAPRPKIDDSLLPP